MKIKSLFVGDTDNTFIQFFRYCFVGGFAFVVDFGVMTLLTEVFGLSRGFVNRFFCCGFVGKLPAQYILDI